MYCTRCGARNDDTNRFCIRCGGALVGTPPAPFPASLPATAAFPRAAAHLPGPLPASGATAYGAPAHRLAAAAVDALVVWVLSGAAHALLGVEGVGGMAVAGGVAWAYFATSESSAWAATPGKRLLGLRVVDRQGGALSLTDASRRFCGKLLAALLLGVGLAMILFDDERQGMHDAMLDSRVVRD